MAFASRSERSGAAADRPQQSTLDSSRGATSVRQVCVISQACDAHRSLIITLYGDGNPCRAVAPFGWEHSLGG
jgi:hypothetical protein